MDKPTPKHWLVEALQMGLIGSIVVLLMALVGMVEEFAKRDIIAGVLEMGQTLLLIALLAVGFLTARRLEHRPVAVRLAGSAASGAVPAFVLIALVQLTGPLNLRSIFLNASPALVAILTFGQPGLVGALVMLGAGVVQGLAGGAIEVMPSRLRTAVIQGLTAVALIGLLQEILRVTLTNIPFALRFVLGGGMILSAVILFAMRLRREAVTLGSVGLMLLLAVVGVLFGSRGEKGLSIVGALVVFALVGGSSYWSRGTTASSTPRSARSQRTFRIAGLAGLVVGLSLMPLLLGPYLSEVTNSVGLFILMGLGLNIVVGYAGLLDLGYVAFYAIGAYTVGVLTSSAVGDAAGQIVWGPQIPFFLALVAGVLVSLLAGLVLGVPVLNIRGDYLAIVTLGFGEIIRILAGSDFLKPYIGGSQGIVQVGVGRIGPIVFDRPQTVYYIVLIACLIAAFLSWRLRDSRMGRAWKALREDEDVAQGMGIHLVSTKLMAFATGAAFAGLSGAIFASKIGSIYPHSFKLLVSINVLALIIVGGMGSLPGVFVGALALVALPELLREFSEYRLLMYGALLIVMMLVRPEGLRPEATRRRELHDALGAEGESPPEPAAAPARAGS
jgi:branched-chain amino acid transport system permease protein